MRARDLFDFHANVAAKMLEFLAFVSTRVHKSFAITAAEKIERLMISDIVKL